MPDMDLMGAASAAGGSGYSTGLARPRATAVGQGGGAGRSLISFLSPARRRAAAAAARGSDSGACSSESEGESRIGSNDDWGKDAKRASSGNFFESQTPLRHASTCVDNGPHHHRLGRGVAALGYGFLGLITPFLVDAWGCFFRYAP